MCLIVVDDCPVTRQCFLDALQPAGFGDVWAAASGAELFDLLPLDRPTPFRAEGLYSVVRWLPPKGGGAETPGMLANIGRTLKSA